MEPLSPTRTNPSRPVEPAAVSSRSPVRDTDFFEGSSCCSFSDRSCCGLFGWVRTICTAFLEFWGWVFGCFSSSPEPLLQAIPVAEPSSEEAQVRAFLDKFQEAEGVIKAESDRGRVYLAQFDALPGEATEDVINALVGLWPEENLEELAAGLKGKIQDSRVTVQMEGLFRELLKNNLNHPCIRKTLLQWLNN